MNPHPPGVMRRPRLKVPPDHPVGFYHCISRVVERRFLFDDIDKDRFVTLLRECERFCRVRVLTYTILSNHFHVLLEVPRRPPSLPGPDEIVADLRRLSGYQFPEAVRQRFDALSRANDTDGLARYLATFHARMYDVSAFMKMLKQRFTQWYNARHRRCGTLWEERFKSVLVDGAGHALLTMAAYIDLNPVRAGLVQDPMDYRWCGYAEALAGRKRARNALQFLVTVLRRGREESLPRSLETYRQHLYLEGDERRDAVSADGTPVRGTLKAAEVARVLKAKGKLPVSAYLKCRVRYFNDGAVYGSRDFVEGMFQRFRNRFGEKRRTGARAMRGLADLSLYTWRDFRLRVFGTSSG
ncbi:MAG: transposase [Verrucomicrobiales bacterium]|nr:transposase [Verrucomicrobiales bacterium]